PSAAAPCCVLVGPTTSGPPAAVRKYECLSLQTDHDGYDMMSRWHLACNRRLIRHPPDAGLDTEHRNLPLKRRLPRIAPLAPFLPFSCSLICGQAAWETHDVSKPTRLVMTGRLVRTMTSFRILMTVKGANGGLVRFHGS